MSYDVRLVDEKGESVTVPRHEDGGTRIVGGTEKAELNITYNYGGANPTIKTRRDTRTTSASAPESTRASPAASIRRRPRSSTTPTTLSCTGSRRRSGRCCRGETTWRPKSRSSSRSC